MSESTYARDLTSFEVELARQWRLRKLYELRRAVMDLGSQVVWHRHDVIANEIAHSKITRCLVDVEVALGDLYEDEYGRGGCDVP